jgi:hypothetical protein
MPTEQSPDDYLDLVKNEVLNAKDYIQLIEVCRYKRRDGEILYDPFYPEKSGDKGTVVRAIFFITTNGISKSVNVLYRVFGSVRRKSDLNKIFKEIARRAHIMYYTRKTPDAAFSIRDISLEHSDWN